MTKQEMWELVEQTQGRIAGEIRRMLGETPIEIHNFTPANQRRRIEAMRDCAANAESDEERHNAWIRKHESEGWQYGEVFDAATKIHPNLLPWDQLSPVVKSKARIFDLMAKLGSALEAILPFPEEITPLSLVNHDKEPQAMIPPDLA